MVYTPVSSFILEIKKNIYIYEHHICMCTHKYVFECVSVTVCTHFWIDYQKPVNYDPTCECLLF